MKDEIKEFVDEWYHKLNMSDPRWDDDYKSPKMPLQNDNELLEH